MRLHDLKPAPGSTKDRKRLGRGNASGQGTTAGKGTKGEKARSGGLKAGFRGMSSRNQRMAKRRGFTNIFKKTVQVVNVGQLETLPGDTRVTPEYLKGAGLVDKATEPVKILGNGELTKALTVEGVALSAGAREKIEKAGGTVILPASEEAPSDSGSA